MIIKPKFRGFLCTAAHPLGCFENVRQQIEQTEALGTFRGPKNVLIIGASTGYGLATRIATGFGAQAKTIGVFFEKPASNKRTASPGWYNTAALEQMALRRGLYAKSLNGDAFSQTLKDQTSELIQKEIGQIDLLVYSLAAPRRTDPNTGAIYSSVLKPATGSPYSNKTVDPLSGEVREITIEPANEDEIDQTVRVMGGEDWELWLDCLLNKQLLSDGAITLAYSYIGPELTHPIYKDGSIGRAKTHLFNTMKKLNEKLQTINGHALISINKALVTQASAAIPVVPLYLAILFKLMKEKNTHEGCIEQMNRLLRKKLYANSLSNHIDATGCIRMDDWEMDPSIQQKVKALWPLIQTDNLENLTDIQGYRDDFYRLFGFGMSGIDYEKNIDAVLGIPSLEESQDG